LRMALLLPALAMREASVVSCDHHNPPVRTIHEGCQVRFRVLLQGLHVLLCASEKVVPAHGYGRERPLRSSQDTTEASEPQKTRNHL
jgi:hypothetical protein